MKGLWLSFFGTLTFFTYTSLNFGIFLSRKPQGCRRIFETKRFSNFPMDEGSRVDAIEVHIFSAKCRLTFF